MQDDFEKNKIMAVVSYFLFFIPLIACPESEYARFHANQSLLLLIVNIGGRIVLRFIPFIGGLLSSLFNIAVLVFYIIGIINAFEGKKKELPIIGGYRIL